MSEKPETPKFSVEDLQQQFKEQLQMQISTLLNEEKYSQIRCVVVVTNKLTGRVDLVTFRQRLLMEAKALLNEAIDMLKRQQIVTALSSMFIMQAEKAEKGGEE